LALRVAAPNRVRAVAIALLAAGIFLLDESGFHGLPASLGVLLFCMGVGFVDGLDEGRVGRRQLGVVLFLVGLAAATWSLVVILLTRFFLEVDVSPLLFLLLIGGVGAILGGFGLRKPSGHGLTWPRAVLAWVRGAGSSAHSTRSTRNRAAA
jgi:hypothetical protein